jgi:hypothetical protein
VVVRVKSRFDPDDTLVSRVLDHLVGQATQVIGRSEHPGGRHIRIGEIGERAYARAAEGQ